jgi:cytochrome c556
MIKRWLKIGVMSSFFVFTNVIADSGSNIERAIAYRQGVYQVMAWNFGPMGAMVKGEIPFDATVFAKNAERVQLMSKMPLEGFIPGSDKGDTEAKPAIWQNWDDFKAKVEKLEQETAKLAELAKTATKVEEVTPQLGKTGKVCKGCHDDYKKD